MKIDIWNIWRKSVNQKNISRIILPMCEWGAVVFVDRRAQRGIISLRGHFGAPPAGDLTSDGPTTEVPQAATAQHMTHLPL